MNLNSDYIKGWLNGYVEIKSINIIDNAYYIKQSEDKLYKICEEFLEILNIPLCFVENNTHSFNKSYLSIETSKDYYLGYLTCIIDIKFKAYLSFYRAKRLNKEYYLQLITTHQSLITNLTRTLKVFGIHYKLLFIPKDKPYSHKYRVRISKQKDMKFIQQLSLTNPKLISILSKIIED